MKKKIIHRQHHQCLPRYHRHPRRQELPLYLEAILEILSGAWKSAVSLFGDCLWWYSRDTSDTNKGITSFLKVTIILMQGHLQPGGWISFASCKKFQLVPDTNTCKVTTYFSHKTFDTLPVGNLGNPSSTFGNPKSSKDVTE